MWERKGVCVTGREREGNKIRKMGEMAFDGQWSGVGVLDCNQSGQRVEQ